jgi:hypothetical protein
MRADWREKEPYIPGKPELYKDDALEELDMGRENKREPYVEKSLKIKEPRREKGAETPIIKKMIRDMQSTELKPLQAMGAEVVGTLFDRVRFLKERITETETAIKGRNALNDQFNAEIDGDIEDMERLLTTLSDKEEIRDFNLNISLLRMEKRKENTSFWSDTVTLRNQLQELNEQHEVESKIADLFDGLDFKKGG